MFLTINTTMLIRFITLVFAIIIGGCHNTSSQQVTTAHQGMLHSSGKTVQERFLPPQGYKRLITDSFGSYLRALPLQAHGALVHLYNGDKKRSQNVHAAVVRMDVGNKDLQQCADAVMRLRAEYLYKHRKYNDIHFNFTNGFRADYSKWRQGYRIAVNGNEVIWVKKQQADTSYASFRQYMDVVFTYAGTLSLSRELQPVSLKQIKPGDVWIQGGSPGHAAIVIDVAVNNKGEKIFMLAQSYMPAQEIHILRNNENENISPWFSVQDITTEVVTPEWTFDITNLKRF